MTEQTSKRHSLSLILWSIPTATVSFLLTQNIRILNPRHVNWLFGSGDISASYTQWTYFRKTPLLQWPLTLNEKFGFPWTKTIIYTDTPPIFAVPLKYLLHWVEGPVQFTGWQIFLSTYLLVFFTSMCLQGPDETAAFSLIGAFSISIAPVLLFRDVFFHYSLNVMWVIPAGIYFVLKGNRPRDPLRWGGLTFVTLTWMPYFLVPILMLFVTKSLVEIRQNMRTWRTLASSVGGIFFSSLLALVINGFWYNASSSADSGLGFYNANLLALINPRATPNSVWSRYIPGFNNATDGQYEGFAFLGSGMLILLVLAVLMSLPKWKVQFSKLRRLENRSLIYALFTAWFFALGFSVDIGTSSIGKINIPQILLPLLGVFRSSGRFMILVSLIVGILCLKQVRSIFGYKRALGIVLLACCVTFIESFPQIEKNKHQQGVVASDTTRKIKSVSTYLAENEIDRVTFISPENSAFEWKMAILGAAALQDIPTNDIFAARPHQSKLSRERELTEHRFYNTQPRKGEVWVIYPTFRGDHADRVNDLTARHCSKEIDKALILSWRLC